eukprot:g1788.t1
MKIVVLGGSGFLGVHLVRELLSSSKVSLVRVLDVRPYHDFIASFHLGDDLCSGPRFESMCGSVLDPEDVERACAGMDGCVHAASLIDFGNVPKARVQQVNVHGTECVIRACRRAGVRALVYTSSLDVAVPAGGCIDGDETLPYVIDTAEGYAGLDSVYAQSKATAEKAVLAASDAAIRTCAVRPLGMYGEGDPYHLGNMLAAARDLGLLNVVAIGAESAARFQHVFVGNVAHAHVCALETLMASGARADAACGQAFFVTDDSPLLNWFTFFEPYNDALGYTSPSLRLPRSVAAAIARALDAVRSAAGWCGMHLHFKLTPQAVAAICTEQTFTGEKIRRMLGYAPKYGPVEAQRRSIAYFQRHPDFGGAGANASGGGARWRTIVVTVAVLLLSLVLSSAGFFVFSAEVPWRNVSNAMHGSGLAGDNGSASLRVFETLRKASSWHQWNTFTSHIDLGHEAHQADGRLHEGATAHLDVNLRLPLVGMRQLRRLEFRVIEVVPPSQSPASVGRICWAYQTLPAPLRVLQPLLLSTRRCMYVRSRVAGEAGGAHDFGVDVRHDDRNSGFLAPLVRVLFKSAIEEGFMLPHIEIFKRFKMNKPPSDEFGFDDDDEDWWRAAEKAQDEFGFNDEDWDAAEIAAVSAAATTTTTQKRKWNEHGDK